MNEVVVVLSESNDVSTSHVLKWINHFGYRFQRINNGDIIDLITITINNKSEESILIKINNEYTLDSNDVISYWHRRGRLIISKKSDPTDFIKEGDFKRKVEPLANIVSTEANRIEKYIYSFFEKKKSIGSVQTAVNNKLIDLNLAQSIGLKIPHTYVLSNKKDLLKLLIENPTGLITKPISDAPSLDFIIEEQFNIYQLYTNVLSISDIELIPETFYPSMFQEYIEKNIEIRTFYLKNTCYSMAIFSQKDFSTSLDFRRYNWNKPNKVVPFKLPIEVENKINKLMDCLNLKSGSIDLIYSRNKEFIFLEVNPVGQFGMVSYPCNYHLEKIIAKELTNKV